RPGSGGIRTRLACSFWMSAWTAASRASERRSTFVWLRRGGSPAVPADTSTSRETVTSRRGERQPLTRQVVVRAGVMAGALTGDLLHPSSYYLSNDVAPRTAATWAGPCDQALAKHLLGHFQEGASDGSHGAGRRAQRKPEPSGSD